jgi:hypothetical protein
VRLRPAQIHAPDHLGPVLCLGAAGAGLDVEIRIAGIHLTREHATEFEIRDARFEGTDVTVDFGDRGGIVFFDGEIEKFAGIHETTGDFVEADDNLLEPSTFLTERLRTLRFVPDVGLLEFALDLGQAFRLAVVVKDTSSTHWCVQ